MAKHIQSLDASDLARHVIAATESGQRPAWRMARYLRPLLQCTQFHERHHGLYHMAIITGFQPRGETDQTPEGGVLGGYMDPGEYDRCNICYFCVKKTCLLTCTKNACSICSLCSRQFGSFGGGCFPQHKCPLCELYPGKLKTYVEALVNDTTRRPTATSEKKPMHLEDKTREISDFIRLEQPIGTIRQRNEISEDFRFKPPNKRQRTA